MKKYIYYQQAVSCLFEAHRASNASAIWQLRKNRDGKAFFWQ